MTLQIKRADTGQTETVQLVGQAFIEIEQEVQDECNPLHSGA